MTSLATVSMIPVTMAAPDLNKMIYSSDTAPDGCMDRNVRNAKV